jgi:hypothetical protein
VDPLAHEICHHRKLIARHRATQLNHRQLLPRKGYLPIFRNECVPDIRPLRLRLRLILHSQKSGHPQTTLLAQLATFGTISPDFYSQTFGELQNASCGGPGRQFDEREVNGMLAAMHGIAPRDEIEGMLAAQMVATYKAAMRCLGRLKNSEYVEEQDSHGNLAVKLLRTHVMQIEALQRYRGKGEQKVTVEHVHVHQGGQAIVGTLHRGEGGSPKIEEQPHAPAITHEPRAALPSPDPQREAVSGPSRKR